MPDPVKDHALTIGEQLAAIEDSIGQIAGRVMRAASTGRSGNLEIAIGQASMLDDQVTALVVDLRRMRKAMRS